MSEQENLNTLDRYRKEFFEHRDIDAVADLMHDDYVEEYQIARVVYENYPGIPTLIDYSHIVNGDLAVVEMILDYDGKWANVCEIVEFEGGRIRRARGYFAEPFEAPGWRAQWVERF